MFAILFLKPLITLWILALEGASSLAFWLGGHIDGGYASVGHLHLGKGQSTDERGRLGRDLPLWTYWANSPNL